MARKESWEFSASTASHIAKEYPCRQLKQDKQNICQEIKEAAQEGKYELILDFIYYKRAQDESWQKTMSEWLKGLGYSVEDCSHRKMLPCFIIKW